MKHECNTNATRMQSECSANATRIQHKYIANAARSTKTARIQHHEGNTKSELQNTDVMGGLEGGGSVKGRLGLCGGDALEVCAEGRQTDRQTGRQAGRQAAGHRVSRRAEGIVRIRVFGSSVKHFYNTTICTIAPSTHPSSPSPCRFLIQVLLPVT